MLNCEYKLKEKSPPIHPLSFWILKTNNLKFNPLTPVVH